MCMSNSPDAPAAAPPAPPPAPPAPVVPMAPAAENSQSDVSKLARQKGTAGLRIDKAATVLATAPSSTGGLNIPQ
jgi:hypothetical protein